MPSKDIMVKQWSTLNRFSLIEIILYFCATKIKYIMDTVKIIAFFLIIPLFDLL